MLPRLAVPAAQFCSLAIPVRLLASFLVSGAILTGQPNGPVEITAMRHALIQGTTQIVIEFSGEFEYHSNRLHVPERIYFDFPKAKLRTGLRSSYSKEPAEETISRVRVAEPAPGITRVVLDLLEEVDISTVRLKNPAQLVIELRPASAVPQIRTNAPLLGDNAPKPDPGQGATLPLKPITPEPGGGTEPEPVQARPGLRLRHALKFSPASTALEPGSVAAIRLELDSPPGEEPQALQWELSYPSPKFGIEDGDLVAGSVASSAGKSLMCAGRVAGAAEYVYRCILAGGLERIPNGAVAIITFRVRPHAQSGKATLRNSNALAVVIDGKEIPIQPNEANITIR
jgi:hypothetical protein